jgi:phosphoribosylformylglycinamidine synthase I
MTIAVLQFPGSNCDQDAVNAFNRVLSVPARLVWHKESSLGEDITGVVVPGGFSYGDYLRCGAIARFSPIMQAVREFANQGGAVLGICNGFQILCESGLLPGALVRNQSLEFRCLTVDLRVEDAGELWNRKTVGTQIRIPIAHGEGNYQASEETLKELEDNQQVLLRYTNAQGEVANGVHSPNGSTHGIAGIRNREGNVWGMMPHPERSVLPFHPSQDGISILQAFLKLTARISV